MPSRDGNIAVKVAWNNQNYKNSCVGPDSEEHWRSNHPSCFYKRIDIEFDVKKGKCQSTCWEQGLFRDWQADIIYNAHAKSIKEGKVAFFVTKKPRTNYKTVIGFMVMKK